jgi:hypothetical protein
MPVILNEDKVWFDESRKLESLCADAAAAGASGHSVLLLSHFESSITLLAAGLREKGIGYERFSSLNPSELCANPRATIWLGSTRAFQVPNQSTTTFDGPVLEIKVAEHHPMQSRDQQIMNAAANMACQTALCFYFSLEDPLMKHFGADPIKALFERLGIDKSECIEHHLINTAIRTAQEKIESKVGRDVPTTSAEDWFKYNLPKK